MTLEYDLPANFETLEELREWVWQQFQRTENEFNLGREAFYVKDSHEEPPKPRNGMIVRADGTNWNPDPVVNPAGEPGYWGYENGQWILFSRTGAALDPDIPNDFVTFAQIENIDQFDILGRATAGSGDIEELTLTQILDFIGSAAEGDLLYRAASAWARLGKGTTGQVLGQSATIPVWSTLNTLLGLKYILYDATANSNLTGTYSRTGTTVTVSVTGHGLQVGHFFRFDATSGLATDGNFTVVSVTDANTFTFTHTASGATSGNVTLPRRSVLAASGMAHVAALGTGEVSINFATAYTSATSYVCAAFTNDTDTTGDCFVSAKSDSVRSTLSHVLVAVDSGGTPVNTTRVSALFIGT